MAREEGRGGGKGTHACRLIGKGVQHAELCGRAEFESLYASRGKGREQTSCHHSQLDLSLGPARREAMAPFSCPFLMPDRPGPTIQSLSPPIRIIVTNRFARLRAWQTREESSGLPEPADNRQVANSCRVLATSRVRLVGYGPDSARLDSTRMAQSGLWHSPTGPTRPAEPS
jgi:hypothetical protein